MNILALVADLEYLRFEACPFALLAEQPDIGKELHLYRDRAVALAIFATPAGNVERELSRAETGFLGLGKGSEQVADSVESLGIGYRVRSWSPADRRLIYQNHIVNELRPFQAVPGRSRQLRAISLPFGRSQRLKQYVVQQTGFSRSRDPGYSHDHPQRNLQIDVFQIVGAGPKYMNGLCPSLAARSRQLDAQLFSEITSSERSRGLLDLFIRSFGNNLAAMFPCPRTEVEDPI